MYKQSTKSTLVQVHTSAFCKIYLREQRIKNTDYPVNQIVYLLRNHVDYFYGMYLCMWYLKVMAKSIKSMHKPTHTFPKICFRVFPYIECKCNYNLYVVNIIVWQHQVHFIYHIESDQKKIIPVLYYFDVGLAYYV